MVSNWSASTYQKWRCLYPSYGKFSLTGNLRSNLPCEKKTKKREPKRKRVKKFWSVFIFASIFDGDSLFGFPKLLKIFSSFFSRLISRKRRNEVNRKYGKLLIYRWIRALQSCQQGFKILLDIFVAAHDQNCFVCTFLATTDLSLHWVCP